MVAPLSPIARDPPTISGSVRVRRHRSAPSSDEGLPPAWQVAGPRTWRAQRLRRGSLEVDGDVGVLAEVVDELLRDLALLLGDRLLLELLLDLRVRRDRLLAGLLARLRLLLLGLRVERLQLLLGGLDARPPRRRPDPRPAPGSRPGSAPGPRRCPAPRGRRGTPARSRAGSAGRARSACPRPPARRQLIPRSSASWRSSSVSTRPSATCSSARPRRAAAPPIWACIDACWNCDSYVETNSSRVTSSPLTSATTSGMPSRSGCGPSWLSGDGDSELCSPEPEASDSLSPPPQAVRVSRAAARTWPRTIVVRFVSLIAHDRTHRS